jgi:cytochrome c oxidase accessory protein FixG
MTGSGSNLEIGSQPGTIKKGGGRRWIHAVLPKGRWQRLRQVTTLVLLILFYATPWITIDGRPFIKLSFLSPSFVLFGNYILQYEIFRFVLLALLLVICLFMTSALIGRAWCGYACPQTIFIEQVLGRIETFFEGPAAKRLLNANKPLTVERFLRKLGKQVSYLLVSFSFAFTLVAIFTGPSLILDAPSSAIYWSIGILTALAWFNGGYWREQFCHIACPYARFQSVMQDIQTRTIGYDESRGEPRGRSKAQHQDNKTGDCIDCGLCVRVCPSGIDIRQGAAQLECTACARCIDACDSVMSSLHRPLGLIRYDAMGVFEKNPIPRAPILRPRIFIYASLLIGIFAIGVWQFIHRDLHHVHLLNVKGTLPYFQDNQRIKNLLTLKIGNQAPVADVFTVDVRADNAAQGTLLESPKKLGPVNPGAEMALPVLISVGSEQVGNFVYIEIKSEFTGKVLSVKKLIAGP